MNSINWGNTIVFALGGAGTGFCISVFIGLVLLFVEYSENNVNLVKASNWGLPIIGAIAGGIVGAVQKETSRF